MRPEVIDLVLADGRRLRARRWDGEGAPLVLLHGMLDSSEGWEAVATACERPCVAFDLPGFGGSDLPSRPMIEAYAEDVLEALCRLELRDVTLVGHSLGGAVAAALAELAAGRVSSSVVLLAPAGFGRIPLAEMVSVPGVRTLAAAALPSLLRSGALVRCCYRLFVTANCAMPPTVDERLALNSNAIAAGAVAATQAVVAAGRARNGLHRRRLGFAGPVTVLWGKQDRVVPIRHAQGVLRAFPRSTLHVWESIGHHPQHEMLAQLIDCLQAGRLPRRAQSRRRVPASATRSHIWRPALAVPTGA